MEFDTELQKNIWLKHIEVQERVLQSNSAPIAIEPESLMVSGNRLFLNVCQTDELDAMLKCIKSFFNVTDDAIDLNNDTLTCDIHLDVDSDDLFKLSEECQKYYIQLSINPIVEGVIHSSKSSFAKCVNALVATNEIYTVDSNRRLQVSVESLRKLYKDPAFPNEILPEKASGVFGMHPTPAYYLRKWFSLDCSHFIKIENYKNNDIEGQRLRRLLTITNYFFSESALQKLNKLWGLGLLSYDVYIRVDNDVLNNYNFSASIYDFSERKDNLFSYHFNARSQGNESIRQILKEMWQIDLLNNIFKKEFGGENFSISVVYNYTYDYKLFQIFIGGIDCYEFFQDMKNKIKEDNISISETKQSIGIDFDWRKFTPNELKKVISNQYDDLEISIYANHRCNIEISDRNANWDKIEPFLKNNYSTLKTYISPIDGSMHFFQEYRTQEQAAQFMFSILASQCQLNDMGCDCILHSNIEGTKKYLLRIDHDKIAENKESIVRSLKGSEFTLGKKTIGKLIRVNYPELIFDISSSDYDFSAESTLSFNKITPNLEGDIEKIKRLKNAFDCISTGKRLKNTNLSDFIFDSTKATHTQDIDYYTSEQSDFYQDIKCNLLNRHINSSQLNAIIKCLKAKDIALIQGPPGTGKSTAIAELIWQHIRLNPQERILLTSETNLAVDNAIDRTVNEVHNLVKPIRFGSDDRLANEGRQFSIAAMEQWVETGKCEFIEDDNDSDEDEENIAKTNNIILTNWLDNISKRINHSKIDPKFALMWEQFLANPDKDMRKLIFKHYKSHCNVVGATCSSIGENNTKNRPTKFFMNYCTVFGEVEQKTVYKKDINSEDETSAINVISYKCKDGISFSTVIQDESSKATPAELALPLIYGQKNIVIGDHRQLPPMLDKDEFVNTLDFLIGNAKGESELRQLKKLKDYVIKNFNELEISHFQRIFENIDDSLKGEFTLQYRMHPDINEVIKQFYDDDNGLECGLINPVDLGVNDKNMSNPFSRYHGISIDDFICGEALRPDNHVVWIDVNSPEMIEGTSRINEGEVEVISHILEKFSTSASFKEYCDKWNNEEDKEIGIISFYSKQRNRIRKMSKSYNNLYMKIDVVDRFQGMERNIIIVSMVRSNTIVSDSQQKPDFSEFEFGYPVQNDLGFAQSPNRLNVALSRAKRLLIIIGNSELFRQNDIYNNVYNIIAANPNGKIIKCNPNEVI